VSPLSPDPEKRDRQLANLRPGAGAWREGATPHLRHGLRSRRPGPLVIGPVMEEHVMALEAVVRCAAPMARSCRSSVPRSRRSR
jgi:hypothetical protein